MCLLEQLNLSKSFILKNRMTSTASVGDVDSRECIDFRLSFNKMQSELAIYQCLTWGALDTVLYNISSSLFTIDPGPIFRSLKPSLGEDMFKIISGIASNALFCSLLAPWDLLTCPYILIDPKQVK